MDDARPGRQRLAANLLQLMERRDLDVEAVAYRAGIDPDAVRLVLAGEDQEVDAGMVLVLSGAVEASPGDLFAGIRWVPYGLDDRPGGEWRIGSID